VASLKVPDSIKSDEEVLFLSDILPTGYFGSDMANVQPGAIIYNSFLVFMLMT